MTAQAAPNASWGHEPKVGRVRRLVYAVIGGNLLYLLLLLNFPTHEASLGVIAYRVSPNPDKVVVAMGAITGLATALAFLVPHHRSLTGLFSHLSFAVLFVPLCAIYTLSDGETAFMLSSGCALAVCFLLFGRQKSVRIDRTAPSDRPVMLVFFGFLVLGLTNLAVQGQLTFSFLSFREVYDLRSAASIGDAPLAGRWISMLAYAAVPYVLVYGLMRKNALLVAFGLLGSYLLYNTFGFKLFLFTAPLAIALYLYMRAKNPFILIYFMSIAILISVLLKQYDNPFLLSTSQILDETFIRRYFYVPGFVSYAWHDTFLFRPFVFWSNMPIIRNITDYPFEINHSIVVSMDMFGQISNPSTGAFGNGFANFGYIGILLFTIIVYLFIFINDILSYAFSSAYLRLGSAMPVTIFIEADPIVTVLSFGFGTIVAVAAITSLTMRFLPYLSRHVQNSVR